MKREWELFISDMILYAYVAKKNSITTTSAAKRCQCVLYLAKVVMTQLNQSIFLCHSVLHYCSLALLVCNEHFNKADRATLIYEYHLHHKIFDWKLRPLLPFIRIIKSITA